MTAVFDELLDTLYASYGTDEHEFVLYYSSNRDDIESYLDVHAEDRVAIEQLSNEVSLLLNQYEQLKIESLQIVEPTSDDPLPVDSQ